MKGIMSRYILFAMLMVLALNSCQEYEIPESFLSSSGSNNQNEDPNGGSNDKPNDDPGDKPDIPSVTPLEAVDMGLSVKWANKNLEAQNVEDEGIAVFFGDAEGNGGFYKADDAKDGDISGTAYDIVHNKLGGKWRMPTRKEWSELDEKTYREGSKFTASSGKSIYLPYGDYWTSSYWYRSYHADYRYYYYRNSGYLLRITDQESPHTKYYIRPVCDY